MLSRSEEELNNWISPVKVVKETARKGRGDFSHQGDLIVKYKSLWKNNEDEASGKNRDREMKKVDWRLRQKER